MAMIKIIALCLFFFSHRRTDKQAHRRACAPMDEAMENAATAAVHIALEPAMTQNSLDAATGNGVNAVDDGTHTKPKDKRKGRGKNGKKTAGSIESLGPSTAPGFTSPHDSDDGDIPPPSRIKKRRRGRVRRSGVWDYFEAIEDEYGKAIEARCCLCNAKYRNPNGTGAVDGWMAWVVECCVVFRSEMKTPSLTD